MRQEAYKYTLHIFSEPCTCTEGCNELVFTAWFPDVRRTIVVTDETPQGAMEKAYACLAEVLELFEEKGEVLPATEDSAWLALRDKKDWEPGEYVLRAEWVKVVDSK